ncbi:hypothetical protein IKF12_00710 [Candidatus Saccharibacteria bacterium]|nr:hypothetical protein [Candidatus Saccharibacteria bacterium]
MEEGQANIEVPAAPSGPVFKNEEKKAGKGMLIGIIVLVILAIAGVAFGVWAMLSQNGKIASLETDLANCAASNNNTTENVTATCPDGTLIETVNSIDNASAQTIINPYMVYFGAFNNLLDHEFDINAKMRVAFDNVDAGAVQSLNREGEWTVSISYDNYNREFQYLFGSDQEIEKRDYDSPYFIGITFVDQWSGSFEFSKAGIGGTGLTMYSIVKDAQYDDGKLIIWVYHGTAPWCQEEKSDSCVAPYTLANSEEINQYIKNNESSIPVYKMIFEKDDRHYVLRDIKK